MNKKNIVFVSFVVTGIVIYLYVYGIGKHTDVDAGNFDIVHDFKYSFNLKNITPREIANAKVWLSGPVAINTNQKSLSIESNQDPVVFRDENNNQELYFNYESISKNEIKHVVVDMQVAFSKQANKSSDVVLDQYLLPEKYIDIEDSEIIELAASLKGANAADTTKNVLKWLKAHKESMSVVLADIDALDASALEKLKKIKTEKNTAETHVENNEIDAEIGALAVLNKQHNSKSGLLYLYLALNRSLGLPSRGIVGFDFSHGDGMPASKATLWAEFYDAGYWHLVNLDEFEQLHDASRFITFKIMNEMPGQAGWEPYSVLHNESALVVDVASVNLTVH